MTKHTTFLKIMQILYIDKLQSMGYEQDNYAIIETIKKILNPFNTFLLIISNGS